MHAYIENQKLQTKSVLTDFQDDFVCTKVHKKVCTLWTKNGFKSSNMKAIAKKFELNKLQIRGGHLHVFDQLNFELSLSNCTLLYSKATLLYSKITFSIQKSCFTIK
jgi:hypothetical protein